MEEVKRLVRKTLLKEYLIKENLDKVLKSTGISEGSRQAAESWAEQINNRGQNISVSLNSDSLDFNRTFYMLEILMYAIVSNEGGSFTFPTTKKTIAVNPDKIANGITVYMSPSHSIYKFASFLSKDTRFKITADEIERLDSQNSLGIIEDILRNMPKIISGYLSNDYYSGINHAFGLYLITAIKWPLNSLRTKVSKSKISSLDEPIYGGDKTRYDVTDGGDYEAGGESTEELYNDFMNTADDEISSAPRGDNKNVIRVMKLNYDILSLIKTSFKNKDLAQALAALYTYSVIGEGGTDEYKGETLTNKGIMEKYYDGTIDPYLKKYIDTKALSDIAGAKKLFEYLPEVYKNFRNNHKDLFSGDSMRPTKVTVDLMLLLQKYGKNDKKPGGCGICGSYSPKRFLMQIKKALTDAFLKDTITDEETGLQKPGDKSKRLTDLVFQAGLGSEFPSGIEYLKKTMKGMSKNSGEIGVSKDDLAAVSNLNEDFEEENLFNEGEFEECIFELASEPEELENINEAKQIRNFIKSVLTKIIF